MKPLHGSSVGISTAGFILARHWICPLPQHSNELSNRNTPRRFYHLLDWVGARREGSTSAFRNRIACPDDAGHRDVTSCKTLEV